MSQEQWWREEREQLWWLLEMMLLQDEAHLSASSNISTVLAHTHSTMQLQLSQPDNNTSWVSALKSSSHFKMCQVWMFLKLQHTTFIQSQAPSGAAGRQTALHPPPTEMPEMCSIYPNLIPVSGVHATENDKLKLLVAAAGWRSLGRKPDSPVWDCFLSPWEAGASCTPS